MKAASCATRSPRAEVAACRPAPGLRVRGGGGVRLAACFDPPSWRPHRGCRGDRTGRAEGLAAPRPPPALVLDPRHSPRPLPPRLFDFAEVAGASADLA